MHQRGETFGLPEGRHGLFAASELGEGDARERVDQRQMTTVAGCVESRSGLRNVLADDRDVANLAVALSELVVCQADRAGVVRGLRVLQRSAVEGNRPRLIAARRRQPTVQAPESGEGPGRNRVAETVRRAAQRGGCLVEVVLQQPGFSQRGADCQFGVAGQRRRAEHGREHLRRFRSAASFER